MEQHEKGCSASNPTSNFYKLYPSNSSRRSRNKSKQGVYEDLEHVIAVSYDPKGDAAKKVDVDWKSGGVMIFDDYSYGRKAGSVLHMVQPALDFFLEQMREDIGTEVKVPGGEAGGPQTLVVEKR